MRFGPVPVSQALDAILAHSLDLPPTFLRKGQRLTAANLDTLKAHGQDQVVVARLDPGDIPEDEAALLLARALVPDDSLLEVTKPIAGRVNLKARLPGVLQLDVQAIRALNRTDPAITLATLAPFARVSPGLLCATVKIITYAVSGASLARAAALAEPAIRLCPVMRKSAGLLLTETPGQDPKLARKGQRAVEARLAALGIPLLATSKVPHRAEDMAKALMQLPGEIVLILTGSATSDLHDTAPNALRLAGGQVHRFGIPVDPGNLLFHGTQAGRSVIGLPGCARSPALNGADWVLERIACGLDPDDDEIAAMGVGGLLKEISVRGRLREAPDQAL